MSKHLDNLLERLPELAAAGADIRRAFDAMADAFSRGGKLLLCGNGGSAADADHWAAELLKGFALQRPLGGDDRAALAPELAGKLQQALPAIPLGGFVAATSAFTNDVDPELVFAQLVWGLGRPGDALALLSTSGNSANVVRAAQVGKARGLATIALTGQGGGKLATLADVCIRAPHTETYRIQEYHLPIYHCLCLMLEEEFFGPSGSARL